MATDLVTKKEGNNDKAWSRNKGQTGSNRAKTGKEPQKNAFEKKFGEGTAFDLDYGKPLMIGLCIYIAVKVS